MREIRNGVYYTYTPSTKYKSNLLVIKLIAPYNIKRASIRALLSRLFEDGSEAIKNKSILEKKLADLYGATLSVSVQRKGNFHEFSLTSLIARPKLLNDNTDKLVEDKKVNHNVICESKKKTYNYCILTRNLVR